MNPILIHHADEQWMTQAIHKACSLARVTGTEIILLRLSIVQHLSHLGTSFGDTPFSQREINAIKGYVATAEDYGVTLQMQSMQCFDVNRAIIEAAQQSHCEIVFAHASPTRIPLLRRVRRFQLASAMHKARLTLVTLETSETPEMETQFSPVMAGAGD